MTFNSNLLRFRRDTLPLIETAERMLPIAAEHGIDLAPRVQWARERCAEIEAEFQAWLAAEYPPAPLGASGETVEEHCERVLAGVDDVHESETVTAH